MSSESFSLTFLLKKQDKTVLQLHAQKGEVRDQTHTVGPGIILVRRSLSSHVLNTAKTKN